MRKGGPTKKSLPVVSSGVAPPLGVANVIDSLHGYDSDLDVRGVASRSSGTICDGDRDKHTKNHPGTKCHKYGNPSLLCMKVVWGDVAVLRKDDEGPVKKVNDTRGSALNGPQRV